MTTIDTGAEWTSFSSYLKTAAKSTSKNLMLFWKSPEDSSQKYKQKLDALLEESKGLICGGNDDEHQLKLNAAIATELETIINDYEFLIARYKELQMR